MSLIGCNIRNLTIINLALVLNFIKVIGSLTIFPSNERG